MNSILILKNLVLNKNSKVESDEPSYRITIQHVTAQTLFVSTDSITLSLILTRPSKLSCSNSLYSLHPVLSNPSVLWLGSLFVRCSLGCACFDSLPPLPLPNSMCSVLYCVFSLLNLTPKLSFFVSRVKSALSPAHGQPN